MLGVFQEEEWLKAFYNDVEKCLRQNDSEAQFVEVCFSVLSAIRLVKAGHQVGDSFSWIPVNHKVTPLGALSVQEVTGGSLVHDGPCGGTISGVENGLIVAVV